MSRRHRRRTGSLERLFEQERKEVERREEEADPYLNAGCDPEDVGEAKWVERETRCDAEMAVYLVKLQRRIEELEARIDALTAEDTPEAAPGVPPA